MTSTKSNETHLYVDGPNIDATLGVDILGRKPAPTDRPRWDRVYQVARTAHAAVQSWFVLNGNKFDFERTGFYRFLRLQRFQVAAPTRRDWCKSEAEDPVDEFIKASVQSTANAIKRGELGGVLIASHDGGYAPVLASILDAGGLVGVIGFCEWFAPELVALRAMGAVLLDLEHDFGAFDAPLDRPQIAA